MDRLTRRGFLGRTAATAGLLSSGSGLAAFLQACAQGGGQPAPQGRRGGHLVEAATDGVQNLNTIFGARETAGYWMSLMMFDGLLYAAADGQPHPLLAASMPTVSQDDLTITFKLRPNVKWTDGQPVTADDVVFSYQVYFAPEYQKTNTARSSTFAAHLENVSAPDPLTVVFRMKNIWAAFLISYSHFGIVPKHILGSLSGEALNTAPFNSNPNVSFGAFKFGAFQQGQQVSLVRNDGCYRGAPYLDGYTYRIVGNSTAIVNGLAAGEIDFGPVDPSLLSQVQTMSSVNVYSFPLSTVDYLYYQLDPAKPGSAIFGDIAVRQALLMALDREKMAKSLYFGQAIVADSPMAVASWAHTTEGLAKYGYDKAKAASLLDGAGWKVGPNGVRQKNGKDLKFELLALSGRAPYADMVANMQAQWQEIGAQATPRLIDSTAMVDQLTNQRNFDVLIFPLNLPADPDPTQVWASSAAAKGGFNTSHWINSQADKLIADGAATLDINQRKKLYAQFQQIFMNELPAGPLFYPKAIYGINKRVQGIQGAFGTYSRFERQWMKDVSVTSGK